MASEKVVTLSADNWVREVEQSAEPVLVDFWAVWCGPCRMIAPVVDEIAADYEGRLKVGKLNVDENSELASRYGVMSIPTLLVFKNGQPVERIVGFQPKKELAAKIDRALG